MQAAARPVTAFPAGIQRDAAPVYRVRNRWALLACGESAHGPSNPTTMDEGEQKGAEVPHRAPAVVGQADAARIFSKVAWRLVPFLFLCYIAAYLDRVNLGNASLTMLVDLKLDAAVYGSGAGVFFFSYFLFEVPSNLILQRLGARRWIARIMVSWGVISMAMAFVQGPISFYALRFLLGAAEAGFFPGIILYLSYWFPLRRRAHMVARFMVAIAVANVIGAPISSAILDGLDQVAGLAGWKWLFLVEGLPSIALGFAVFAYLVDRPREARFLTASESAWLEGELEADRVHITATGRHDLGAAFSDLRVWWLSAIHFFLVFASYGLNYWLPQVVKSSGDYTNQQAILISGVPYAVAGVAMLMVGWNSDRSGERRWHIAVSMLVAASGFLIAVCAAGSPLLVLSGLSMGAAGICSALPIFWALPAEFLTGAAAAGGFAMVNALGNLGGYAGPKAMGLLKSTQGSADSYFANSLSALACSLVIGAFLTVAFPAAKRRAGAAPP
jgi:ACS family tartrate transporter-like MFS transporter